MPNIIGLVNKGVFMLSLFLALPIHYGVIKSCSDDTIVKLNAPLVEVIYVNSKTAIFNHDFLHLRCPMPAACSVTNTFAELEFNVTKDGVIDGLKFLNFEEKSMHARCIKKALLKAEVSESAYNTKDNKVTFTYTMYINK